MMNFDFETDLIQTLGIGQFFWASNQIMCGNLNGSEMMMMMIMMKLYLTPHYIYLITVYPKLFLV